MTIWQNFTLAYRRISKKWNKYAVVMLLFMIPAVYSFVIQGIVSVYVMFKTSLDVQNFIELFLLNELDSRGMLNANMSDSLAKNMAELNLDFNTLARTMFVCIILDATTILSAIFTLFLSVPTAAYFIGIARRQPVTLGEAFKLALGSVPLTLMLYLRIFLWSLLFVIPGIIKAFAYSQAFYIKADHPTWSANECIDHSNKMMKGKKGRLFLLMLLMGIAIGIVSAVIENIATIATALITISNTTAYILVSSIVGILITLGINVYAGVYENTVLAIFYEDARRSYIDNVEQDLRRYHENGYDSNNHSNPFDETNNENAGKQFGGNESTNQNGETAGNNDSGTDPFGL